MVRRSGSFGITRGGVIIIDGDDSLFAFAFGFGGHFDERKKECQK